MNIKLFEDEKDNDLFIKLGLDLIILSNGIFRIENDINSMKLTLKGITLESELI
mgnify:CR=1 FL=1